MKVDYGKRESEVLDFGDESSKKSRSLQMVIKDQARVQVMLREKLYKDGPASVVREVFSNAYDANIEAGNPDTPVRVTLPDKYGGRNFIVEDDGVGISYERADKIFRQYFESTKKTDGEIGGFGLGGKSPYAICSIFHVITTVEENDKLVTYVWECGIDENNENYMNPVSREAAKVDKTGTTIRIPVSDKHLDQLLAGCYKYLTTWPVKPTIVGRDYDDLYGNNTPTRKSGATRDYFHYEKTTPSQATIFLEHVPYTLSYEDISKIGTSLVDFCHVRGQYPIFKNGELMPHESREYIDKFATYVDVVREAFEEIKDRIVEEYKTVVPSATSIYEARSLCGSIPHSVKRVMDRSYLEWNGLYVDGLDFNWRQINFTSYRDHSWRANKFTNRKHVVGNWNNPSYYPFEQLIVIKDDTKSYLAKIDYALANDPAYDGFSGAIIFEQDELNKNGKHLGDGFKYLTKVKTSALPMPPKTYVSKTRKATPYSRFKSVVSWNYLHNTKALPDDIEVEADVHYVIFKSAEKLYFLDSECELGVDWHTLQGLAGRCGLSTSVSDLEDSGANVLLISSYKARNKVDDEWSPLIDTMNKKLKEIEDNKLFPLLTKKASVSHNYNLVISEYTGSDKTLLDLNEFLEVSDDVASLRRRYNEIGAILGKPAIEPEEHDAIKLLSEKCPLIEQLSLKDRDTIDAWKTSKYLIDSALETESVLNEAISYLHWKLP